MKIVKNEKKSLTYVIPVHTTSLAVNTDTFSTVRSKLVPNSAVSYSEATRLGLNQTVLKGGGGSDQKTWKITLGEWGQAENHAVF